MSRLIETMRIEQGVIANPEYHARRIKSSSDAVFKKQPKWDVDGALNRLSASKTDVFKCRMLYDSEVCEVVIEPYTIRPVASLKLVANNSIVYNHKFADRSLLNAIFLQRSGCDDVLIVKNGTITDVTYANIIFRKGDEWVTPDTYLLNGTMRQWLIDTKQIREERIAVDDLKKYSHFKLVNAMLRLDAQQSEVSNIR
jgi:4-amino-4-deoxychorismate lyase